jgi:hypothetical protein
LDFPSGTSSSKSILKYDYFLRLKVKKGLLEAFSIGLAMEKGVTPQVGRKYLLLIA